MLIQNSIFRNNYTADGITTTFAYTTPVLEKSWLAVYQQLPDAEEQTLVPQTEYSLTGIGSSFAGNVVFNTAPAAGTKLAFVLNVPISQLYKYTELDNFPAESHEDALAKLTLICQMIWEKANRAITVSETSTQDPAEYSDDFFEVADQVHADAEQVAADKETIETTVTSFDDHVTDKKAEITAEGETQVGLVEAAGTAQIGLVEDAGTAQIGLVEAAGTTQVGLVKDEGDAQVARVQEEGAIQVGLAEDQAEAAEGYAIRAETAAEEAEEIVHPSPATTSSLGLVQIGSGINVDPDGVISAQEVDLATTSAPGIVQIGDGLSITPQGVLSADIATTQAPGRVQIGDGLAITPQGVLSADVAPATTQALGTVKVGDGLAITPQGVLSADIATTQVAGRVKVGDNLSITQDGTLSADAQGGSTYTDEITDLNVADYADGTIVVTSESVDSDDSILGGVPVGTIIWSMKATVPAGYLLCNGSAVGRETYPELFAAIGTAFGSGDGSTTFNLPNLIDKFIEGGNAAGTVKAAGLPNITGGFHWNQDWYPVAPSGAFDVQTTGTEYLGYHSGPGNTDSADVSFDASRSSSIYGASNTVQPPAITALPCIKAFAAVIGDATVVAGQLVNEVESCAKLDGSNIEYAGADLKEAMAHMGMPSDRYVEMTLPASGTILTAPADGYYQLGCLSGANTGVGSGAILFLGKKIANVVRLFVEEVTACPGAEISIVLPVSKNDTVLLAYEMRGGSLRGFHFVYANGSPSTVNP